MVTHIEHNNQATIKIDASINYRSNNNNNNNNNSSENVVTVDLRYKNYRSESGDVGERSVTFTLARKEDLDWDTLEDSDFACTVENYFTALNVEEVVSTSNTASYAIAEGYFDMLEEDVEADTVLLVNIELYDRMDTPRKITMAEQARAFLGICGVRLSKVSSSTRDGEYECPICLVEMAVVGEVEVARLPCSHCFHGHCIVKMVIKCNQDYVSCPMCRFNLTPIIDD